MVTIPDKVLTQIPAAPAVSGGQALPLSFSTEKLEEGISRLRRDVEWEIQYHANKLEDAQIYGQIANRTIVTPYVTPERAAERAEDARVFVDYRTQKIADLTQELQMMERLLELMKEGVA